MRDAIVIEKAESPYSADIPVLPSDMAAIATGSGNVKWPPEDTSGIEINRLMDMMAPRHAQWSSSVTTKPDLDKRFTRQNRSIEYKRVDPELARTGLTYRYPDEPARVAAYVTALELTQDDMPTEVIAIAFGDTISNVDRMRHEAVAAAAEAASIKPEFRIIPYKWLARMQMGHRPLSEVKRHGATAGLPFTSIAHMREVFSARRPSFDIGVLGQAGLAAVRAALGIKMPVRTNQLSNSATTIRAALAVVQRNLNDPLVREALAKWRALP